GASVWSSNGRVYAASGNALNPNEGIDRAESVLQLDASLHLLASNNPNIQSRGDLDLGSTPMLFRAPGCSPQLTALNKNGTLYLYTQAFIAAGPVQQLRISGIPLIGLSAYSPAQNLVYTPVDSPANGLSAGLVAHRPGSDCLLHQAWNVALGASTTFSS